MPKILQIYILIQKSQCGHHRLKTMREGVNVNEPCQELFTWLPGWDLVYHTALSECKRIRFMMMMMMMVDSCSRGPSLAGPSLQHGTETAESSGKSGQQRRWVPFDKQWQHSYDFVGKTNCSFQQHQFITAACSSRRRCIYCMTTLWSLPASSRPPRGSGRLCGDDQEVRAGHRPVGGHGRSRRG